MYFLHFFLCCIGANSGHLRSEFLENFSLYLREGNKIWKEKAADISMVGYQQLPPHDSAKTTDHLLQLSLLFFKISPALLLRLYRPKSSQESSQNRKDLYSRIRIFPEVPLP